MWSKKKIGLVLCFSLMIVFSSGCGSQSGSSLSNQGVEQLSKKSKLTNEDILRLENTIISSPDEESIRKVFSILKDKGIKINLNQLKYLTAKNARLRFEVTRGYLRAKSITPKEKEAFLNLLKQEKKERFKNLILRVLAKFDALPKEMMSQVSLESDKSAFRLAAARTYEKKESLTPEEIVSLVAQFKVESDDYVSDAIIQTLKKHKALAAFKNKEDLSSERWKVRQAAAHTYENAESLTPDEKTQLISQLNEEDDSDVTGVLIVAIKKHHTVDELKSKIFLGSDNRNLKLLSLQTYEAGKKPTEKEKNLLKKYLEDENDTLGYDEDTDVVAAYVKLYKKHNLLSEFKSHTHLNSESLAIRFVAIYAYEDVVSPLVEIDQKYLLNRLKTEEKDIYIDLVLQALKKHNVKPEYGTKEFLNASRWKIRLSAVLAYKTKSPLTSDEKTWLLDQLKVEDDSTVFKLIKEVLENNDAMPELKNADFLTASSRYLREATVQAYGVSKEFGDTEKEHLINQLLEERDPKVLRAIAEALDAHNVLSQFKNEAKLSTKRNWSTRFIAAYAYKAAKAKLSDEEAKLLKKRLEFEGGDDGDSDVEKVIREALIKHGFLKPQEVQWVEIHEEE